MPVHVPTVTLNNGVEMPLVPRTPATPARW
jgi:hypothetical protein